jgi:hypothetical protein
MHERRKFLEMTLDGRCILTITQHLEVLLKEVRLKRDKEMKEEHKG